MCLSLDVVPFYGAGTNVQDTAALPHNLLLERSRKKSILFLLWQTKIRFVDYCT